MKQNPRNWDWQKMLENGDFKKTDEVLETGAMFGLIALEIAPRVKSIVVTDSYHWAKRRFTTGNTVVEDWEKEVTSKENIRLERADMQLIPYQDESFDKVVCVSAIEHVVDDRKALEEMMRVLKPGGLLLLTTDYHPFNPSKIVVDEDKSFYRIYSPSSLGKRLNGFNIVKQEVQNDHPEDYTTIFLAIKK